MWSSILVDIFFTKTRLKIR